MLMVSGWLLALIAASALCCWSQRFCRTEQFSRGRSRCDSCAHPLTWWQLIPVVGVLVQRGRCYFCAHPISLQSTRWELAFSSGWLLSYYWWSQHQYPLITACGIALWSLPLMHQDATLLAVSRTWLIGGTVVWWSWVLLGLITINWGELAICVGGFVPLFGYAIWRQQLGGGDAWYCLALSALGGKWMVGCLFLATSGLLLRRYITLKQTAQPLIWALGIAHWLLLITASILS